MTDKTKNDLPNWAPWVYLLAGIASLIIAILFHKNGHGFLEGFLAINFYALAALFLFCGLLFAIVPSRKASQPTEASASLKISGLQGYTDFMSYPMQA